MNLADQGCALLLVNNVGIQGEVRSMIDVEMATAQRVFGIAILSVLSYPARALSDARGGGSIVNLASMAGVNGAANLVAFVAAKVSEIGFPKTAVLGLEASRIRVNAARLGGIEPGVMWGLPVAKRAETPSQYSPDEDVVRRWPACRYQGTGFSRKWIRRLRSPSPDDLSYNTGWNLEISGGTR